MKTIILCIKETKLLKRSTFNLILFNVFIFLIEMIVQKVQMIKCRGELRLQRNPLARGHERNGK